MQEAGEKEIPTQNPFQSRLVEQPDQSRAGKTNCKWYITWRVWPRTKLDWETMLKDLGEWVKKDGDREGGKGVFVYMQSGDVY